MSKWFAELTHEARHAYAEFVIFFVLSRQIRAMRKSRAWTQAELADRSGLAVLTVNRIERFFGCRRTTITTLTALAAAFDVALIVRFCSWGEWFEMYIGEGGFIDTACGQKPSPIPTFTEELQQLANKELL
jgi:transcriptional regulator with XRE-family HTH domain